MEAMAYEIRGGDFEQGGSASRALKEQLKKAGADPAVVRRAMIAAYEAEMNVVIHSHGGVLRARLDNGQLDVEVIDTGPGIPDVDQAMRPGFSTASAAARELGFGAGMGLPNIKKNSDEFAIESTVGAGTTIRFRIILKPQALYGAGEHSLQIAAENCRQSFRCLHACPTQAVRVFRGKPQVLDYLCIDCTCCIAACPSGTLTMGGTAAALPCDATVLVVTPESLVQFGPFVPSRSVLDELARLGVGEVWLTSDWDAALRRAVLDHAANAAQARPVISPACPAVVNLVETRFPSLLPHLAPFGSATDAIVAELGARAAVFVLSCPARRTAVLSKVARVPAAPVTIMLPSAFRAVLAPRLAGSRSAPASTPPCRASGDGVLQVTGMGHVFSVLESIENGLAGDVQIVEPWACDEGCFGSPLLSEDACLARARWEAAPAVGATPARALRRDDPPTPRRGLRLDDDMAKAIQKLGRIDKLRRTLPGSDCGMCGAPTCAALAEDIVLGRAQPEACVRQSARKENAT